MAVADEPMGEVKIPLDSLNQSGNVDEKSYPLQAFGRMKTVTGELRVRCSFNRPPDSEMNGDNIPDDEEAALLAETADRMPNELIITVCAGRKLLAVDRNLFGGGASSDPFVKIRIDGFDTKKTAHISKNLNPTWNEKIVYQAIEDPSLAIRIDCEDYNLTGATHIGSLALSLKDFDDQKPSRKWYKLKSKHMEADGVERGELELQIQWKFTVESEAILMKKREKEGKSLKNQLGKGFSTMGKALKLKEDDEIEIETDDEVSSVKVFFQFDWLVSLCVSLNLFLLCLGFICTGQALSKHVVAGVSLDSFFCLNSNCVSPYQYFIFTQIVLNFGQSL